MRRGISVAKLKQAINRLQAMRLGLTAESIPAKLLVTDGEELFLVGDGGAIELLRSGQFSFAFVLELESLQAALKEDIGRMESGTRTRGAS